MTETFLRRKDAAAYLKERFGFAAASTLAKCAVTGNGPEFCERGRIPLYRAADLDDWARPQLTGPIRSPDDLLRNGEGRSCDFVTQPSKH